MTKTDRCPCGGRGRCGSCPWLTLRCCGPRLALPTAARRLCVHGGTARSQGHRRGNAGPRQTPALSLPLHLENRSLLQPGQGRRTPRPGAILTGRWKSCPWPAAVPGLGHVEPGSQIRVPPRCHRPSALAGLGSLSSPPGLICCCSQPHARLSLGGPILVGSCRPPGLRKGHFPSPQGCLSLQSTKPCRSVVLPGHHTGMAQSVPWHRQRDQQCHRPW